MIEMIIHTKKEPLKNLMLFTLRREQPWVSYVPINCILQSSSADTNHNFFCLSSSDFSLETRFLIYPQCVSPRCKADVIKGSTIKKGLHLNHYTVTISHADPALQNCINLTHKCNFILILKPISSMSERENFPP